MEKIKLINATIGYLNQTVIKNLSLTIEEGKIVGIFGPNGAGKTTFICGINGLARIIKGSVFINDIPLNSFTAPILRRNIGYVPQMIELDPKLPFLAEDVIFMGIYGKKGILKRMNKIDLEKYEEIVNFLEIKEILKKPFGLLSGGEIRKVLIASALIKEPEILLLDETFTFLDKKSSEKLKEKIKDIHRKRNITILIVSHEFYILEKLCHKIIWMENGNVIFYDKIEKLKNNGNN